MEKWLQRKVKKHEVLEARTLVLTSCMRAQIVFFTPIVKSTCQNGDTAGFWRSERILAYTCSGT